MKKHCLYEADYRHKNVIGVHSISYTEYSYVAYPQTIEITGIKRNEEVD